MKEEIEELTREMKGSIPGCMGVGLFSLDEGLIIVSDIAIPDYDSDYAAATHSHMWDLFKKFLSMLPPSITGRVNNILLETKAGYLQLNVIGNEEYLLMAGMEKVGNIGFLRAVMKKYKVKFESLLKH